MNSFGTEGENEGEKKEENEVMKSEREAGREEADRRDVRDGEVTVTKELSERPRQSSLINEATDV